MSRPNVVLIVMDTARERDVFPADGTEVAPFLSELTTEGTRFEQAVAAAPWTLPSHASLFTGTYPSKHGAHADHKRLEDHLAALPDAFQNVGYETVAVSNNTWISEEFGFGRGFDRFHKTWQYVQSETDLGVVARTAEGTEKLRSVARMLLRGNPIVNVANALYGKFLRKQRDSGARRTNRWIRKWLANRDDEDPFFLFVNYLEPHLEYRPPAEYAEPFLPDGATVAEARDVSQDAWAYIVGETGIHERDFELLRALYRGEIAYLDERLRALRTALEERGAREETVFVVTSDHGENVGDHGMMDHQYCLYETLLHVPLVIHGGPFTDGAVREDLVSLTDLAPTLLDVAGIDGAALRKQSQGRSLVAENGASRDPTAENGASRDPTAGDPTAGDADREVFAEYLAPRPSLAALEQRVGPLPADVERFDRSLRAVRTPTWKLVRGSDGSLSCYDLATDPDETDDRSATASAPVADLTTRLDEWLESFEHAQVDDSEVAMAADTKRRLEELGYLQE